MEGYNLERRMRFEEKKLILSNNCIILTAQSSSSSIWFSMISAYFTIYSVQE
jgi:hypothetical protein